MAPDGTEKKIIAVFTPKKKTYLRTKQLVLTIVTFNQTAVYLQLNVRKSERERDGKSEIKWSTNLTKKKNIQNQQDIRNLIL